LFIHVKKCGSIGKVSAVYLTILLTSLVVTFVDAGGQTKHLVTITGFKFVPAVLNVERGDTIVWVNHDIVPHSIVVRSSKEVVSPVLESGTTFTYVVGSSLVYACGLHPSMKGKLVIP